MNTDSMATMQKAAHRVTAGPTCMARQRAQAGVTLLQLIIAIALVGLLSMFAIPAYVGYIDRARVGEAIGDLGVIEIEIEKFEARNNGQLPATLADIGFDGATDPWGNAYLYSNFAGGAAPRTDGGGDPVNDEYDLVSIGRDGLTANALTNADAQDDIVRGNNGSYLGLVEDYTRL